MQHYYIKDIRTGRITGHQGVLEAQDLKGCVVTTEEEYNQQHTKVYSKAVYNLRNGSN